MLVNASRTPKDTPGSVNIVFPVKCEYRGGHKILGKHGRHLWIEEGKIGYGGVSLTHWLPLTDVASVDVTERAFGGSGVQILVAPGMPVTKRVSATAPRQVTDITVRTKDGQQALWIVQQRGAEWVREKLAPVLHQAGIPFYDDVPPSDRTV
jgi:hypothetical protein